MVAPVPAALLRGDLEHAVGRVQVAVALEPDAQLHRDRGQVVRLADVEHPVGDAHPVALHLVEHGVEAAGHQARQVPCEEPEHDAGDR